MNANSMVNMFQCIKKESLCIEVTTHCNCNCVQCFVQNRLSEHSDLSIDAVKTIIAEGFTLGFRQLHLTGGEPLLWNGLFEVIDFAFEKGYKTVTMNTNGSLLTAETTRRLAAYKKLSISVSLDGPEAIHDRLRGKGAYRQTVPGIENALGAGVDLKIFSIARKGLIPVLPHFANWLFKQFCGIKYLTLIQLICIKGRNFTLSKELLDVDDFISMVQTVALLNLNGLKIRIKNSPLASIVADFLNMPWIAQSRPLYRYGSLMIRANGNISLSHSTEGCFGKYAPGMMQKTINSREYRTAVAPNRSICTSCKYIDRCRQSGIMQPLKWCTDSLADTPYCKKILDRVADD